MRRLLSTAAAHGEAARVKQLLVVWHSRTGLAQQMTDAMVEGAYDAAEEMGASSDDFRVVRREAANASVDDVLQADGYLFCAPENLASVSGEMLEFFHRSYYQCFEAGNFGPGDSYLERSKLLGRPYGLAIAAGSDGTAAANQVARICQGWRLQSVCSEPLIEQNQQPQTAAAILAPKLCSAQSRARCAELGGLVAATLLL